MKWMNMKHWVLCGLILATLTGCHPDLWNQDRYEPLEGAADVFGEGESSSRPLVEGTVPYQGAKLDDAFYLGLTPAGKFSAELPKQIELNRKTLERGQERYGIYCAPCHGDQGLGDGMIVQRGFPTPTNFSDPRLLESPVGYYYSVMTNGFGRMYSYKSRIPVEDRWAIAAYVKVLQLSQNATADNLPAELLEEAKKAVEVAKKAAEAAKNELIEDEVKVEH